MSQNERTEGRKYIYPFLLTAVIIILDQVSKALIIRYVELYPSFSGYQVIGNFFRIIHTRNLGIAFSLGRSLPGTVRYAFFTFLPLIVMVIVLIYYFRADDITPVQRWALAGILGGGFGNIIDRFFRPEGVVDFLDFKFYGIFGLNRWPTFNIADSSVVLCGILLIISIIITEGKRNNEQKN